MVLLSKEKIWYARILCLNKARDLEKAQGKDARRKAHDSKQGGEGDRTKQRINEDYY